MATPGFAQMAQENEGLQKMLHRVFCIVFFFPLLSFYFVDYSHYRPQRSFEGYVCQSFCSQGGVCPIACWDTLPPPPGTKGRHPPADGSCCERYAIYWNVFFFDKTIKLKRRIIYESISTGASSNTPRLKCLGLRAHKLFCLSLQLFFTQLSWLHC